MLDLEQIWDLAEDDTDRRVWTWFPMGSCRAGPSAKFPAHWMHLERSRMSADARSPGHSPGGAKKPRNKVIWPSSLKVK